MATNIKLSKISKVDLRDCWSDEAKDFTPWLASEENIALLADVHLDRNRIGAKINATERQGKALIDATYDLVTEAYTANLTIDSLQINHFLPYDSIFNLTATMQASGKGLDFMGRDATAKIQGTLQNLHYKNWQLRDKKNQLDHSGPISFV